MSLSRRNRENKRYLVASSPGFRTFRSQQARRPILTFTVAKTKIINMRKFKVQILSGKQSLYCFIAFSPKTNTKKKKTWHRAKRCFPFSSRLIYYFLFTAGRRFQTKLQCVQGAVKKTESEPRRLREVLFPVAKHKCYAIDLS